MRLRKWLELKSSEISGPKVIMQLLLLSRWIMSNSLWPLWTVVHWASLSMGFSRQESWSGLPFLSPGDLPDPGIEPASPAWQEGSLPLSHLGIHQNQVTSIGQEEPVWKCKIKGAIHTDYKTIGHLLVDVYLIKEMQDFREGIFKAAIEISMLNIF